MNNKNILILIYTNQFKIQKEIIPLMTITQGQILSKIILKTNKL